MELALLIALGLAAFGWQAADDGPRAGQALAYLQALVLFAAVKGLARALPSLPPARRRLLGLVCTLGMWVQAAGLACTAWYERLASRTVGVCDEGTGLPVGLLLAAGTLIVAAEFIATRQPPARRGPP